MPALKLTILALLCAIALNHKLDNTLVYITDEVKPAADPADWPTTSQCGSKDPPVATSDCNVWGVPTCCHITDGTKQLCVKAISGTNQQEKQDSVKNGYKGVTVATCSADTKKPEPLKNECGSATTLPPKPEDCTSATDKRCCYGLATTGQKAFCLDGRSTADTDTKSKVQKAVEDIFQFNSDSTKLPDYTATCPYGNIPDNNDCGITEDPKDDPAKCTGVTSVHCCYAKSITGAFGKIKEKCLQAQTTKDANLWDFTAAKMITDKYDSQVTCPKRALPTINACGATPADTNPSNRNCLGHTTTNAKCCKVTVGKTNTCVIGSDPAVPGETPLQFVQNHYSNAPGESNIVCSLKPLPTSNECGKESNPTESTHCSSDIQNGQKCCLGTKGSTKKCLKYSTADDAEAKTKLFDLWDVDSVNCDYKAPPTKNQCGRKADGNPIEETTAATIEICGKDTKDTKNCCLVEPYESGKNAVCMKSSQVKATDAESEINKLSDYLGAIKKVTCYDWVTQQNECGPQNNNALDKDATPTKETCNNDRKTSKNCCYATPKDNKRHPVCLSSTKPDSEGAKADVLGRAENKDLFTNAECSSPLPVPDKNECGPQKSGKVDETKEPKDKKDCPMDSDKKSQCCIATPNDSTKKKVCLKSTETDSAKAAKDILNNAKYTDVFSKVECSSSYFKASVLLAVAMLFALF
jgi:hypothetical protein